MNIVRWMNTVNVLLARIYVHETKSSDKISIISNWCGLRDDIFKVRSRDYQGNIHDTIR